MHCVMLLPHLHAWCQLIHNLLRRLPALLHLQGIEEQGGLRPSR